METLHRKTRVFVQAPDSVVRRKARLAASIGPDGVIATDPRRSEPFVCLAPTEIAEAEVVTTLTGRGSTFRPFRGRVLRLVAGRRAGGVVVGIVLPTADADRWLELVNDLRRRG